MKYEKLLSAIKAHNLYDVLPPISEDAFSVDDIVDWCSDCVSSLIKQREADGVFPKIDTPVFGLAETWNTFQKGGRDALYYDHQVDSIVELYTSYLGEEISREMRLMKFEEPDDAEKRLTGLVDQIYELVVHGNTANFIQPSHRVHSTINDNRLAFKFTGFVPEIKEVVDGKLVDLDLGKPNGHEVVSQITFPTGRLLAVQGLGDISPELKARMKPESYISIGSYAGLEAHAKHYEAKGILSVYCDASPEFITDDTGDLVFGLSDDASEKKHPSFVMDGCMIYLVDFETVQQVHGEHAEEIWQDALESSECLEVDIEAGEYTYVFQAANSWENNPLPPEKYGHKDIEWRAFFLTRRDLSLDCQVPPLSM